MPIFSSSLFYIISWFRSKGASINRKRGGKNTKRKHDELKSEDVEGKKHDELKSDDLVGKKHDAIVNNQM